MERVSLKAERMAPEGAAIARAEGSTRVIFVPYGVPGDRLEAEIIAAKSTFARGRLTKLLEPGPERIDPPCPHHFALGRPGPACGGCDWQQLSAAGQLRHKREVVIDCLSRIGKLKNVAVAETIPSPRPWKYRNKVQIPFGHRPGAARPVAGFYEIGSHRIVDFEVCPVQPDLSVAIALKVKELAGELKWPIYDPESRRGWLRHLYLRTNEAGQAVVALVSRSRDFPREADFVTALRAAFPQIVGIHHNVQPEASSVILGPLWRRVWGARGIEEKIGRFTFHVSPGAFLQVNTLAAEKLYDAALAALTDGGARFEALVDIYCGAGTLSLWAASAAKRVIGIEENREAVKNAYDNAARNGVKNVRFQAGRAEALLPRLGGELRAPAAALVDPPRAGLTTPVLRALTAAAFRRVVYVSCDPATFARDAGYLSRSGYALRRVQPLDLFPQTSHVEMVGLFDRS